MNLAGPVDPYAPSEPVAHCQPAEKPGCKLFRAWWLSLHGGRDGGIARSCGGRPPSSAHHEGRAWDWFPIGKSVEEVDRALEELLATKSESHELARRAGIRVLIWNGRIWNSAGGGGWSTYKHADSPDPTLAHRDHVHFAFSWAGARGETSLQRALVAAVKAEALGTTKPAPKLTHIVPARRTPIALPALREVLQVAHAMALPSCPREELSPARLRLLWCLACHETDQSRSCWNHNLGNIACTANWPECHALRVRDPKTEPVHYRSYPSHVDGAIDLWKLLARRYPEALVSADTGAALMFAVALRARGYFGQTAELYGAALERHGAVYDRLFNPV